MSLGGQPFIIHALGRSRTAWLSAFLSYGNWQCFHEVALTLRSMDDFRAFFARRWVGAAETGAILAWPLIQHECPDIRSVVIKRDVREATEAMRKTYLNSGIPCDEGRLASIFRRADMGLDKISELPNTLTLSYGDLDSEEGCRRIFEFCLRHEFDRDWWLQLRDQHIEADLRSVVAYYWANREGVENFKKICKTELIHLVRSRRGNHAVH